jgi:alkylhydroperoxidase family enzyme
VTWLAESGEGDTAVDRLLGLVPAVRDRYRDLDRELWAAGRCDPALLQLCRVRIAELLGDEVNGAPSPDPEFLGLRERACLAFTEAYVLDPHSVTDEMTAEVLTHLTPAEATALTMALAVFDATTRMRVALA